MFNLPTCLEASLTNSGTIGFGVRPRSVTMQTGRLLVRKSIGRMTTGRLFAKPKRRTDLGVIVRNRPDATRARRAGAVKDPTAGDGNSIPALRNASAAISP